MGKQNNLLYHYLSDNRRFADLFNGSQFQGEQVICADQLTEAAEHYAHREENGTWKDSERDIKKLLHDGPALQILAIENQMYDSCIMPLRCMEYDAREYRTQVDRLTAANRAKKCLPTSAEWLSGLRRENRISPVYTIVVYWGEEKWQGPRELKDMMDFGDHHELEERFHNYSFSLVCLNEIENSEDYKTDLREVLRLVKYQQDKQGLYTVIQEREEYHHLSEDTYDVLVMLLHDKQLDLKKENVIVEKKEKEEYDMCLAIQQLIEDGKSEGIKEGIKEGMKEGTKGLIRKKLQKGCSAEEIADILEEDVDIIQTLIGELQQEEYQGQ